MPDYVTKVQLQAEIPEVHLVDALDDDKDGAADDAAWNEVLATASTDVDALLSGRYPTPFEEPEDWDEEEDGAWTMPPVVKSAAFVFAGEKIYKRRRTSDDENPFFKRAEFWRERLGKIGAGELPMDARTEPSFTPGAAVIEDVRLDETLS